MRAVLTLLMSCFALFAVMPVGLTMAGEHGGEHEAEAKPQAEAKHEGEAKPAEKEKAEAGAEHGEAAAPEAASKDGTSDPPPRPLWPATPAVETERQPFVLMRTLRSVQDQVAKGSATAHEFQKRFMADVGGQFLGLPPAVWDDVRNVRAAIYFTLSGGDPRVLTQLVDRDTPPFVDRRLLNGALAFGEGRSTDARGLLEIVNARSLDPALGGLVALIQGTLTAKKEPKKAIAFFDDARLLSPGSLIEESALRQEILLLAKEGDLERFDTLSAQYSRRFGKSLFASNFRRQFIAGFARQSFKGTSEWISRTEIELAKAPEGERLGMYLAIAEEATKNGHIEVAKFAAGHASQLAAPTSRELSRANLYEGAVEVATDGLDDGVAKLGSVERDKLGVSDRDLYDAAFARAQQVRRWPAPPADYSEPLSASVTRAQTLVSEADTLLGGGSP